MAELAVINIITKNGEDLAGGYASSTYGISNGVQSRANGQFGYGQKLDNGLKISLTGAYSKSNRSNETVNYTTNFDSEEGESVSKNYADSSLIKNTDLNLSLGYKELNINAIYQEHLIQYNNPTADWVHLGGLYLGAKYNWEVKPKLTITPNLTWKKVNPWTYKGSISGDSYDYLVTNYRSNQRLTAKYELTDKVKLTFGAELYQDKAVKPADSLLFSNNETEVNYNNSAVFGEVLIANKVANFIIGARYDKHNQSGSAFVPRFAVTKVIDKLHFKGLVSRAFKAPVITNLEINPDIKPEFTTVIEIESGYQLNDNLAFTANIFYTEIVDPIVYLYLFNFETNEETEIYKNETFASTIGTELVFKINYDWGYINSGYSFYKNNNTKATPYINTLDDNILRGFPAHKLSLVSGIQLSPKLTIAPTIIYNSKKISLYYQEEFWEKFEDGEYKPNVTMNFMLHYEVIKGVKISAGAYDIFNQKYTAASAYDSGYPGTTMMGQEFTIKAKYSF